MEYMQQITKDWGFNSYKETKRGRQVIGKSLHSVATNLSQNWIDKKRLIIYKITILVININEKKKKMIDFT